MMALHLAPLMARHLAPMKTALHLRFDDDSTLGSDEDDEDGSALGSDDDDSTLGSDGDGFALALRW